MSQKGLVTEPAPFQLFYGLKEAVTSGNGKFLQTENPAVRAIISGGFGILVELIF